jgi:hypothetical protein
MEVPKIVQELLDKKAEMSNIIDLDAYANGLLDMYQALQLQQTGVIKSVCDCKPTEYYINEIRYFKCRFCGKVMK